MDKDFKNFKYEKLTTCHICICIQVAGQDTEATNKNKKRKQHPPAPDGFERCMHTAVNMLCSQTSTGQLAPPPSRRAVVYDPDQANQFWPAGFEAAVQKICKQFPTMLESAVRDKMRA
jgi:hypothetical protein